jgi:hypothetical protein
MEESRQFAQTNITGETDNLQANNGDTEKFDMIAVYIPATLPAPETPASVPEKTETKPKTATTPGPKTAPKPTTIPKTPTTIPNATPAPNMPTPPRPTPPKGPTH